ncbi:MULTISPECIES: type VI secretion system baseplate subunit TssE [Photorhabdus]|uniref:Type VI secretion system baseplate subunit TssE n=2 Tax=Photorhabdus TaxID=29487 RepID=A0ABX0AS92_9GAMM|nr:MULTISPECIES: type VI secretion system baseplate subunit TssE [Photorhabdus]MCC8374719.1 type VI secretion system baseplate subunit TssE [Photorhabdus bodei]MCC8464750.1 type VI secretion system baseplate subunit TssE [Photorhabdus bodei]MCT8351399.1 type VI secretion system baseplate subunit TssE [Photorhabdus kayaii]MDB6368741.1 type VI secretion system baseplate subunit TssE [Photorhabdus bodei]NDL10480.1 type VI secretion system baseplate subunit TssE [Photorhabdus kayaii]
MMIQPSFLHRLKDDYPQDENRGVTLVWSRQEVIQSLIADLSMLFSSRPISEVFPLFGELSKSVLNYGVSDVINVDISDDERIDALSNNIYQAISRFEPRLQDVVITLQKNTPENITFWVKGIFFNEQVVFSISWNSTAYTYSISWDK